MHNSYVETLMKLQDDDNYRSLPEKHDNTGIDLCSNDYLGLNDDAKIYAGFYNTHKPELYKFSSASSRLLSNYGHEFSELENMIASYYGREDCLVFTSGYNANLGSLSALAGKNDLIITDKLVHASILDGVSLSKATHSRFQHLNYLHLEEVLQKTRGNFENVFIVSESIYSMDGDMADLNKLVELKKKYNAFLYLDEAHAIGVRGHSGLGCSEEKDLIRDVDFIVGTFGKAIASVGAFVVCNSIFKSFLVNHSRALIYSTALPTLNLAWTSYIFQMLPNLSERREKLICLSHDFSRLMGINSPSHIIPYIAGSNADAIKASQILKENGYRVLPIRYPTVPKGSARLRFSLTANLNFNQLVPIKKLLE